MPPSRVLIAGDDAETCETLAAGVHAGGHTVDRASTTGEALELARDRDYAVCLLDFAQDGCRTAAKIRILRQHCFFFVLMASKAEPALAAANGDSVEIVSKPCRADDVYSRIGRAVQLEHLRQENAALRAQLAQPAESDNWRSMPISVGMTLRDVERILITATIQHTQGNIKEAASVLGIDRSTLYEKIRKYAIPR